MNVLFSGGNNWYPAIIGSKAVPRSHFLPSVVADVNMKKTDKNRGKICTESISWKKKQF